MRRPRALAALVPAFAVCLVLGTSSLAAEAAVPAAKAPVCAGKTKGKAIKAIKAAFDKVLNGSSGLTLDQKFAYVQGSEDPAFNAVLVDIANKNQAMLVTTSVKVNKVTCSGKKSADVDFDLVLAGQVAAGLAPAGNAVLDGKTWKMGSLTVCNLFALADPTLIESGPCATIVSGG